ncbi:MAG TPA: DUF86 domain-containing protein [Thermoanaerobaculia bacterium]|nr:DUF86 domain-containing protein [Thermoanaerobaculia bacterium]
MRDDAYLLDMLLAARQAIKFTEASTAESFRDDQLVQNAVIRVLQVLGEASRRVSPKFKQDHPAIPWAELAGLRNRLVHEYMKIDLAILWEVVQVDLEPLVRQLTAVVPREDPI